MASWAYRAARSSVGDAAGRPTKPRGRRLSAEKAEPYGSSDSAGLMGHMYATTYTPSGRPQEPSFVTSPGPAAAAPGRQDGDGAADITVSPYGLPQTVAYAIGRLQSLLSQLNAQEFVDVQTMVRWPVRARLLAERMQHLSQVLQQMSVIRQPRKEQNVRRQLRECRDQIELLYWKAQRHSMLVARRRKLKDQVASALVYLQGMDSLGIETEQLLTAGGMAPLFTVSDLEAAAITEENVLSKIRCARHEAAAGFLDPRHNSVAGRYLLTTSQWQELSLVPPSLVEQSEGADGSLREDRKLSARLPELLAWLRKGANAFQRRHEEQRTAGHHFSEEAVRKIEDHWLRQRHRLEAAGLGPVFGTNCWEGPVSSAAVLKEGVEMALGPHLSSSLVGSALMTKNSAALQVALEVLLGLQKDTQAGSGGDGGAGTGGGLPAGRSAGHSTDGRPFGAETLPVSLPGITPTPTLDEGIKKVGLRLERGTWQPDGQKHKTKHTRRGDSIPSEQPNTVEVGHEAPLALPSLHAPMLSGSPGQPHLPQFSQRGIGPLLYPQSPVVPTGPLHDAARAWSALRHLGNLYSEGQPAWPSRPAQPVSQFRPFPHPSPQPVEAPSILTLPPHSHLPIAGFQTKPTRDGRLLDQLLGDGTPPDLLQ
ncbi:hypothetical protein BESB_018270 [Besnoitia besnoiti]|uniref:Uncharacterized protein n=1 Tax=Besnoitia besnoiti TaxID=94643 RepID=A0A2A9M3I9_BESBE|nr:hypothetical protein BESB_018270 [Besnoitia besnoiti]PFH32509.1 hypothetical protein BESB_018270 [Besnoitia besnoiti]